MPFCPKCGKEIRPDAKFCQGCGNPVGQSTAGSDNADNSSRSSYTGQNASGYSYQRNNSYQYSGNRPAGGGYGTEPRPVHRTLSSYAGSPMFLVYCIILVVQIIFSIVGAASTGGAGVLVMLIFIIPTIFVFIAMLMAYADCKNHGVPYGSGIGLYKAAKVINLVFIIIAAIALIVMAVAGGYGFSYLNYYTDGYYYGGGIMGAFIILIIIAAVVLVLAIVQQIKLMGNANTIRYSLQQGYPVRVISSYPAVINIIAAILIIIFAIMIFGGTASISYSLGEYGRYMSYVPGYGGIVGTGIALLISAFQMIFGAVLIFKLKNAMLNTPRD